MLGFRVCCCCCCCWGSGCAAAAAVPCLYLGLLQPMARHTIHLVSYPSPCYCHCNCPYRVPLLLPLPLPLPCAPATATATAPTVCPCYCNCNCPYRVPLLLPLQLPLPASCHVCTHSRPTKVTGHAPAHLLLPLMLQPLMLLPLVLPPQPGPAEDSGHAPPHPAAASDATASRWACPRRCPACDAPAAPPSLRGGMWPLGWVRGGRQRQGGSYSCQAEQLQQQQQQQQQPLQLRPVLKCVGLPRPTCRQ